VSSRAAGGGEHRRQFRKFLFGGDEPVLPRPLRPLLHPRHLLYEPGELHLTEEGESSLPVRFADPEILHFQTERHVIDEGHQLLREEGLLPPLLDLAPTGALQLLQVLVEAVQRAVAANQLGCGLAPDPTHAGDVVRRVAGQGEDVSQLFREYPELPLHFVRPVKDVFHGVQDLHVLPDELEKVLVAAHDDHLNSRFHAHPRRRGQQVVRLVPRRFQDRYPEGIDQVVDDGDLGLKVLRHGGARSLVLLEDLVPGGRALAVEGDSHVFRLLVTDDLQQHGGEAVDGVGGETLGVGEIPYGVKSAIDVVVAVDQVQTGPFPLRHLLSPMPDAGHYSLLPASGTTPSRPRGTAR
jgi:hypothetical protein